MAHKRDNGTGTIYQRENKSWVGKIYLGIDDNGKKKFKYLSGKTEAEVKRKIREYNQNMSKETVTKISLGDYLRYWERTFKFGTIKESSYNAIDRIIRNQIVPAIGYMQLKQVSAIDIKKLLSDLKAEGYSYSLIKKVYDCLSAMFKHAIIADDIQKNPMLLVKMFSKSEFTTKEIVYFNDRECAKIIEECRREYSTGKKVYQYGDAFILMLNTGLRLGEAIGLMKDDWDKKSGTIHVRRNIQSTSIVDDQGNVLRGRRFVSNTTKTYSGDRVIPLNKGATEAIERLCADYPYSKYIICSSKGELVPPERLDRTFYRILRNIGIKQTGVHSLRHTFASMLFAKEIDIKTISNLLGHASIQITLNTYIHLINNPELRAVAKLDDVF